MNSNTTLQFQNYCIEFTVLNRHKLEHVLNTLTLSDERVGWHLSLEGEIIFQISGLGLIDFFVGLFLKGVCINRKLTDLH